MRETWVRSLGWEDPLEKGKATHYSILTWRIPWIVHGVTESQTQLSDFHFHLYSLFAKLKWFSLKLLAIFCSKYVHFSIRYVWTPRSVASLKPHHPDAST